jgi:hypothetical protein
VLVGPCVCVAVGTTAVGEGDIGVIVEDIVAALGGATIVVGGHGVPDSRIDAGVDSILAQPTVIVKTIINKVVAVQQLDTLIFIDSAL